MFCRVINEGTAPRYAPEGSQPTSKPVAPKGPSQDTSRPPWRAEILSCAQARVRLRSTAPQQPGLVPLPVAVLLDGALVVLLLAFGEPDLQLGEAGLVAFLDEIVEARLAVLGNELAGFCGFGHGELGARRCGAVKRWVAELYPVVAARRGFLGQSRHARSQALGARRPAAESTV